MGNSAIMLTARDEYNCLKYVSTPCTGHPPGHSPGHLHGHHPSPFFSFSQQGLNWQLSHIILLRIMSHLHKACSCQLLQIQGYSHQTLSLYSTLVACSYPTKIIFPEAFDKLWMVALDKMHCTLYTSMFVYLTQ